MSGFDDDDLTRPLEGAREAATAEGPTSPEVGRDEWVARHGEQRVGRRGPLGTARGAPAPRPLVGLADAVRRAASRSCRSASRTGTGGASPSTPCSS